MDNLRIEKPMLLNCLDGVGYSSPRCPARAALGVCHNALRTRETTQPILLVYVIYFFVEYINFNMTPDEILSL
jgi:hypothetical protein